MIFPVPIKPMLTHSPSLIAGLARAACLGLVAGLILGSFHPAVAQSADEKRAARWVIDHVDLDLLPVAFVIPRGRLSVDGPMKLPPLGFPASSYSLYPNLQYGLASRTQAALGIAGAERLGPGGQAIFYTMGLQHMLLPETHAAPALSVGGYGFLAPHNRHGGAVYLVASKQITPHPYPRGVFVHLGLLAQSFTNAESGTAARPFLGVNYVCSRRLYFSAEYRPRMSWERTDPYTLRAVALLYRRFGVSGGLRQNGYEAHPFIGLEID